MMEIYSDNTLRCSALLYKMLLVFLVGLIGLLELVSTRHIIDTSSDLDLRISRNSPHTECYTHVHRMLYDEHQCGDSNRKREKEIIVENGKAVHYCTTRHGKIISETTFEQIVKWYNNGTEAVDVPECYKPPSFNLCCLAAQMGNKMNYCPEGKRLACYNGKGDRYNELSMPLCDAPLAEKPTKLNCKCYQSNTPLCDEENMIACNRAYDYKECIHKTADSIYRCVCSPVNGDTKLHSNVCPKLRATQTNDVHIEENTTNLRKTP